MYETRKTSWKKHSDLFEDRQAGEGEEAGFSSSAPSLSQYVYTTLEATVLCYVLSNQKVQMVPSLVYMILKVRGLGGCELPAGVLLTCSLEDLLVIQSFRLQVSRCCLHFCLGPLCPI